MADIAKELRRAVNKSMDHAGTMPAKEAVKLRPTDWNAVIDASTKAADALDAAHKRIAELEAALFVLPLERQPDNGWQPTHRHVKRGTEYEHIGTARLQTDEPLGDMAYVEVYLGRDGDLWVRNHSEFYDGRFEALPSPPSRIDKEDRNG